MALIQDAVLGLLAREPSHGYALRQAIQELLGEPEEIPSSSVYMAIRRLEEAGAIERAAPSPPPGSEKRPRFTYDVTELGHERFDKWLAQPPGSMGDLRLRIGLAQPLDDLSSLIDWVVAEGAQTQKRLGAAPGSRGYTAPEDPWAAASAIALSALEFRALSARAQWLAEAHAQLQSLRALASSYRP
jgi:DNA-binding PadR family transcriptional regulator